MRDAKGQIEAKGARLVIVGNGLPTHASHFAQQHGLQGAVYTDPDRIVYRAAGMKRGLGSTFSWDTLKSGARAFKKGFRQTRTQGDPWQQGGTLVVRADGTLAFEHISQAAGDHAAVADVLAAL